MNTYTVGVFPHEGVKKMRYMAYTYWYNPLWPRCCEHKAVEAINGTEAKRKAIWEHKNICLKKKD